MEARQSRKFESSLSSFGGSMLSTDNISGASDLDALRFCTQEILRVTGRLVYLAEHPAQETGAEGRRSILEDVIGDLERLHAVQTEIVADLYSAESAEMD